MVPPPAADRRGCDQEYPFRSGAVNGAATEPLKFFGVAPAALSKPIAGLRGGAGSAAAGAPQPRGGGVRGAERAMPRRTRSRKPRGAHHEPAGRLRTGRGALHETRGRLRARRGALPARSKFGKRAPRGAPRRCGRLSARAEPGLRLPLMNTLLSTDRELTLFMPAGIVNRRFCPLDSASPARRRIDVRLPQTMSLIKRLGAGPPLEEQGT
jgi:hypothetical protein